MEMTKAMKNHVESGIAKIGDHFEQVIDVGVVLSVEKRMHRAEINLHANGLRINAKESSDDMYVSIDSALQKVERQIEKYKDRINRHKPRSSREAREYEHHVFEVIEEDAGQGVEKPIRQTVHREKVSLKTMNVDEAVLQLNLLEDMFLVFSNADTQQVNVLYARPDGTYGLIEPQF